MAYKKDLFFRMRTKSLFSIGWVFLGGLLPLTVKAHKAILYIFFYVKVHGKAEDSKIDVYIKLITLSSASSVKLASDL